MHFRNRLTLFVIRSTRTCSSPYCRQFAFNLTANLTTLARSPIGKQLEITFANRESGLATCKMSTYPIEGSEDIMTPKSHGTTDRPVMDGLRWNCSKEKADEICCFNRHYAEHSGYWEKTTFLKDLKKDEGPITFCDSVSGKPLFIAPKGRTWDEFIDESSKHGWPSFRDEEVVWENVRCLPKGEAVSLEGTHLGHNLPDKKGNRYCINLVSVAGVNKEA